MDRTGDELLAHARLAGDEDRGARPCDEVDGRLERAHCGRGAHDLHVADVRGRRSDPHALAGMPPQVERAGNDSPQLVTVAWLEHVLESASLDRLDRLLHSARPGDENDG